MMPKPSAEKEADALIALFQGCFNRRKEIEAIQWKMNFSLWTLIVVSGWALHTRSEHLGRVSWMFLLVVVLHWFATHKFETSIKNAVNLALGYVLDLETLIGHKHSHRPLSRWPWHIVEVGPTILLSLAAIKLIS